MAADRYRPFPNSLTYMAWLERNCCRCANYVPDSEIDSGDGCPIEEALAFASIDDGTISVDVAERMGYAGACKSWLPNEEAQKAAARAATLPLFPELEEEVRRGR